MMLAEGRSHMPGTWAVSPLGEVALQITKGSTPTTYGYAFQTEGINFIKIENVREGRIDTDSISDFISEAAHKNQRRSSLSPDDVLFSIAGTIGEIAIVETSHLPANTNQAFAIISGYSKALLPKFLEYQLRSFVAGATRERARGGAMNNVSLGDLKELNAVIAPFPEQTRIVAKLEELFSELDHGVESLKTTREKLSLYRATLLDHQFRSNAAYSVEPVPLTELIGTIQQGWSPKCDPNRAPEEHEWAVIKTTAVQPMSHLPNECKPLPPTLEPRPAIEVRERDLLMTRKGPRPRTGVVCLAHRVRARSMLCDTVYRFRANEERVSPEYLELALNSPRVVAELNRRKSGINESGISLNHGKIKSVDIPVVHSKTLQAHIVSTVREKLSLIERIEHDLDFQLGKVEALRQSILKRAFSGSLVPQDPSDEPASVLLERIKAEKEQAKQNKQKRKDVA